MKKLIIILFWTVISALTAYTLTSCEKSQEEPIIQQEIGNSSENWYLTFNTVVVLDGDTVNISFNELPALEYGNYTDGYDNLIGYRIYFAVDDFELVIYRLYDSTITEVQGAIGDYAFGDYNGTLNFCHGPQGVNYNLNIRQ